MQEICWFLRYFTRKDELLRASSGFDSLWERQNDGYPVVFSFQGIVLSHATALQNPDVRADARLCVQAHHLAIPSLRSLRFPVGTPKSRWNGSYFVRQESGVYPAYHMNKEHWISVILDESTDRELTEKLLDMSVNLTATVIKKAKKQSANTSV